MDYDGREYGDMLLDIEDGLPSVPPLASGSLPLAGRRESSGMTVRNTRAFASRGGACECYFISVQFEGGRPPGRDTMPWEGA